MRHANWRGRRRVVKFAPPIPFEIVHLNNSLRPFSLQRGFEIKTLLAIDFHHSNCGTSCGILLYRNSFTFIAKMSVTTDISLNSVVKSALEFGLR